MQQIAIPFMQFRGGSSKGLFFAAHDLPADPAERDRLILATMEGVGIGDPRQIDGLGGATSLTSKVAVVSRSQRTGADLDYLFLQVVMGKGRCRRGRIAAICWRQSCRLPLSPGCFRRATRSQVPVSTWSIRAASAR